MRNDEPRSLLKRGFIGVLKLYASLCTLLVTVCLVLILWDVAFRPTEAGKHERPAVTVEQKPEWLDLTKIGLSYDSPRLQPAREGQSYIGSNTVRNEILSEPDSAANGSQPIRSVTNRTPSAAGSRR